MFRSLCSKIVFRTYIYLTLTTTLNNMTSVTFDVDTTYPSFRFLYVRL